MFSKIYFKQRIDGHRPVFSCEAMLGDTPAGQGSGESKKDAQREAARAALEKMAKEG